MELLLRVLKGIVGVVFEVDGDFEENLTVGFAVGFAGSFTGETMVDFIGESIDLIGSELDLKIGFTFKGVFQADSDSTGDFGFSGSSAWFSVNFDALEGLFVNFDNFGLSWSRGISGDFSAFRSVLLSGRLVGVSTGGSTA